MLHALVMLTSATIANARAATIKNLAAAGDLRAHQVLSFGEQSTRLRLTLLVLTTALQVAIATLAIVAVGAQTMTMPVWLAYLLTGAAMVGLTLVLGELVPDTKSASALLKELRATCNHIASVVDEYGGTGEYTIAPSIPVGRARLKDQAAFRVIKDSLTRCIVPEYNGTITAIQKEHLWDKYFMEAPERQRQSVAQYKTVKRA